MTPNVYGETLFQENILSPFHRTNRRYYRYSVTPALWNGPGLCLSAHQEYPTGRNTSHRTHQERTDIPLRLRGRIRHDPILHLADNGQGRIQDTRTREMRPESQLRFMGNKITGKYTTIYDLPKILSDSLNNAEDTTLMAKSALSSSTRMRR